MAPSFRFTNAAGRGGSAGCGGTCVGGVVAGPRHHLARASHAGNPTDGAAGRNLTAPTPDR
jgi:hypothetical protein